MFKWARKFYRLHPQMAENLSAFISTTVLSRLSEQNYFTKFQRGTEDEFWLKKVRSPVTKKSSSQLCVNWLIFNVGHLWLEPRTSRLWVSQSDIPWDFVVCNVRQGTQVDDRSNEKHIREVNEMFYDERKRVQERYKEYDGTYLGHYVQYFFWFFFALGVIILGLTIFLLLDSHYHWSK